MGKMGINDIGDVPFCLKDDIKIKRRHGWNIGISGQIFLGVDDPLSKGLNPIDIALFGLGQIIKRQRVSFLRQRFGSLCRLFYRIGHISRFRHFCVFGVGARNHSDKNR